MPQQIGNGLERGTSLHESLRHGVAKDVRSANALRQTGLLGGGANCCATDNIVAGAQ